ncbi:small serum protein 5-like [Anolis carolinensis]|uniref:small serum protein 5-like n=1 Tax=Anolis carolinensis TaxID=28377 RepID=UPI002F2B3599
MSGRFFPQHEEQLAKLESRMKVLLSLLALSLSLALCNGACSTHPKESEMKNGKPVFPKGCVDPYNEKNHKLGDSWNTMNCLKCECKRKEVECCPRRKCKN